ncbi:hypothetical protein Pelo_17077 [Pelomyxa schiedti]|nr:hypothetical protein Pelo_17077 [Pelomyxa schiedti]
MEIVNEFTLELGNPSSTKLYILLDCMRPWFPNKLHQLPAGMVRLTHLADLKLMDIQLTYCKTALGEIGSGIQVAHPVMVERAIIGEGHLLEYLERKLANKLNYWCHTTTCPHGVAFSTSIL